MFTKLTLVLTLAVTASAAVLNVKNCPGVAADGTTDDTESIQKCVDSQAGSCGKILFPVARYMLKGSVSFDSCGGQIEIEGEGGETSKVGRL